MCINPCYSNSTRSGTERLTNGMFSVYNNIVHNTDCVYMYIVFKWLFIYLFTYSIDDAWATKSSREVDKQLSGIMTMLMYFVALCTHL